MEIEQIKALIEKRYSERYQGDKLEMVVDKILAFPPALRLNLIKFLETNELHEVEILGYSLSRLMKENNMNEIAAHLTIDWIFREPEKAIEGIMRGIK